MMLVTALFLITVIFVVVSVFLFFKLLVLKKNLSEKGKIEEFSQEFLVAFSEDLSFLFVSHGSTNVIDFDSSFLQGHKLEEFIHPDDYRFLLRLLEVPKSEDRLISIILRCRHGAEGWCWVKMYGKKMQWKSQKDVLVCYIRNVDSYINLRTEHKNDEKKLKTFLGLSVEIVWEFDIENREVNILTPIVYERHHIPSRIPGRVIVSEFMPQEDIQVLENIVNSRVRYFYEHGQDVAVPDEIFVRLYGLGDSRVWYSVRGVIEKSIDGRLMLYGSAHMVHSPTDKNDPDIKLHLFDSIMSLPYVRFFWINKEMKYIGCNQTFASDLGLYDISKVIGEHVQSFSMNEELKRILNENILNVFSLNQAYSGKEDIYIGDKIKTTTLFYSFMPLVDESKSVNAVLGVYQIMKLGKELPEK